MSPRGAPGTGPAPRVVVVTARWGEHHGDAGVVLRLFAGALVERAEVEVVSIGTTGPGELSRRIRTGNAEVPAPPQPARPRSHKDGLFVVHEVSGSSADPVRAGLLRAALIRRPGEGLPEIAGARLADLAGAASPDAAAFVIGLRPDVVVLGGPEMWWMPAALRAAAQDPRTEPVDRPVRALGAAGAAGRAGAPEGEDAAGAVGVTAAAGVEAGRSRAMPRLVSLPLFGTDRAASLSAFQPLWHEVDGVGVLSASERRHAGTSPTRDLVDLNVAFSVNRSAADGVLVGMTTFGRCVAVLSGFPQGTPGSVHAPGHDYLRERLGAVAVAEVAHDRWLITDSQKWFTVPVKPSRVNLWRLLRHSELVIDLRPQDVAARETIESLLLGTPVLVPDGSVAAEVASESNGGLWYRDFEELFVAARRVLEDPYLRSGLSSNGQKWAEAAHGRQREFADQAARLTFGQA